MENKYNYVPEENTEDFLNVAPIKEDWGGDGRGRMNLSGRCTAISKEYIPRQYQFFDANSVPEENGWRISGMPENVLSGKRRSLTWNESGASTSRVFLPPEFEAPSGIFTADLELFVLKGTIQLGEWQLSKHGYSFIPAGVRVGPWKVLGGEEAEILWMENGFLKHQNVSNNHPDARLDEFIPALDSKLLPWGKTDTVQFVQASKKWLRKDSNGGGVWLITILPHYDGRYSEIQSYNEEGYCLAGYCDVGDYRFVKDHYLYCPSFSTIPKHRTDDGGLFLIRVDRDLSKIGTVLSYALK
ncbi:MAG: DUF4437 domain-containing protein [Cyanomargarita calcarea GSE-NOS-MK-12-04C]|jgi:hypothetical protein|uniref:DUF4437 domain-containing protein n=1 Tax=Cyanomargarita calcarea GSE-NOS-MK-12-04C TaxID=2839659 RepID=A0A951UUW7_9CYAN|nr:DUF4437 domain-containing protein [Cyanomargarita calcarea GSE-NOS-MK-12-04C]